MTTTAERAIRRFTVAEVERMVEAGVLHEGEPVELLDGVLFMVPPQGPAHSHVATVVRDRLLAAYGSGHVVRQAMPMVVDGESLPEPDVAVFRGVHADFASRHPSGGEASLVVEIAATSLAIDRQKASLYARAGVPAYWLVDLNARRLEAHEDPQPDGRYRVVRVLAEGDEIALPGLGAACRVRELFG